MKDTAPSTSLGTPPEQYDPRFFNGMLRKLELAIDGMKERGVIRVSNINISDLPTSSSGLRSGDLWNDTGTVKVVT